MNAVIEQHGTGQPFENLLSRLEHVQQHGNAWRARCPAHGSDKNRALSVAVGDDGRILLHCFAGCDALTIVHNLGLELSDLFPARITHATTPAQRREIHEAAKQSQWQAALDVLALEARIVQVAGAQIKSSEPLDDNDTERLDAALERIESARLVLCGR